MSGEISLEVVYIQDKTSTMVPEIWLPYTFRKAKLNFIQKQPYYNQIVNVKEWLMYSVWNTKETIYVDCVYSLRLPQIKLVLLKKRNSRWIQHYCILQAETQLFWTCSF